MNCRILIGPRGCAGPGAILAGGRIDPTTSDIDAATHPLEAILDRWRRECAAAPFSRTRDMGDAFEELCAAFLTHAPVQALDVEDVVPFKD